MRHTFRWILGCCLALGCGAEDRQAEETTDSGADGDVDGDGDGDGDGDSDGDSDSDGDGDSDGDAATGCDPLPAPEGTVIRVTPDQASDLQQIVAGAATGDTVLLADGTYSLAGSYIWIDTPGVTLRSESGDPEAVVLDGEYNGSEIITIAASDVTVAELTVMRAYTHPIHVVTGDQDTLNTRIYRVRLIDPREQTIKINPSGSGAYADYGEIACSTLRLTDAGRPEVNPTAGGCYTGGVDAHQARGWVIRDNTIEGFWCDTGLSEHAVHLWRGCRDTTVERNRIFNCARGIGFGLATDGDARVYDDAPCPEGNGAYVGHYGGVIRNNFILADDDGLLGSPDGFDCGICLWSACGASALHNTIVSSGDNFSSVEWRFEGSQALSVANNLVSHALRERDGASATAVGNIEAATPEMIVDFAAHDLHLPANSPAVNAGEPLTAGLCEADIDADPRDDEPDVGADEISPAR